jgi:hypothetical protein
MKFWKKVMHGIVPFLDHLTDRPADGFTVEGTKWLRRTILVCRDHNIRAITTGYEQRDQGSGYQGHIKGKHEIPARRGIFEAGKDAPKGACTRDTVAQMCVVAITPLGAAGADQDIRKVLLKDAQRTPVHGFPLDQDSAFVHPHTLAFSPGQQDTCDILSFCQRNRFATKMIRISGFSQLREVKLDRISAIICHNSPRA